MENFTHDSCIVFKAAAVYSTLKIKDIFVYANARQ